MIISSVIRRRSDIFPVRSDTHFFTFLIDLISLFSAANRAKCWYRISLAWLPNQSKFRFSSSLRQILKWFIALPELEKARFLLELSFIEEQSVLNVIDCHVRAQRKCVPFAVVAQTVARWVRLDDNVCQMDFMRGDIFQKETSFDETRQKRLR
jgi:hypothetical protein